MRQRTRIIKRKNRSTNEGTFFKQESARDNSFFNGNSSLFFFNPNNNIQRKCADCRQEEKEVRRKETSANGKGAVSDYVHSLDGKGQSLSNHAQHFFGSRLNHDLRKVKIHTDNEAAQSAAAIHSQAYTFGQHIVFNKNKYQPDTAEGRKLLSHELAHVLQQSGCSMVFRQPRPSTPPSPDDLMPVDPAELAGWRERRRAEREMRARTLRESVLGFMYRSDGIGFTNRLRSLTRSEAFQLLFDQEFRQRLADRFRGTALWSVFSILLSRERPNEFFERLTSAILQREAQQVADLLSTIQNISALTPFEKELLRIVIPQIFSGHRLYSQIWDLLQPTPTAVMGRLDISVPEAHYETDQQGHNAISFLTGSSVADFRVTQSEMRVIVRLNFVHPQDYSEPFYFIGGRLGSVLSAWLQAVDRIWNNQFRLINPFHRVALVFVPLIVHSGQNWIEMHENATEHCTGENDIGRSNSGCFFTSDTGDTFAHEFGHLIGASDEYHLPATAAEIPGEIRARLSAQDINLTTVEGINQLRGRTGSPPPAVVGGYEISGSLMAGTSSEVHVRHLMRLLNAINAQVPPAVRYQLQKTH